MNRPDYIKCVRHTHEDFRGKSWCGRPVYNFDWVFCDLDHAAHSQMNESRLLPCPECLRSATDALNGKSDLLDHENKSSEPDSPDVSVQGDPWSEELQRVVSVMTSGPEKLDADASEALYGNLWDLYD